MSSDNNNKNTDEILDTEESVEAETSDKAETSKEKSDSADKAETSEDKSDSADKAETSEEKSDSADKAETSEDDKDNEAENNDEKADSEDDKKEKKKSSRIFHFIGYALTTICFITFWFNKIFYVEFANHQAVGFAKGRILAVTVIFLATIFVIHFENKFSKALNRIMAIFLTVITPIVTFRLTEFVTGTDINRLSLPLIWANIFIIAMVLLLFLIFTNSFRIGPILTLVIFVLFATVNFFIYKFRGNPIMASDLATIKTAANVASAYTINFTFEMFFAAYAIVAYSILLCKVKYTKMFGWKLRIPFVIVGCIGLFFFVHNFVLGNKLNDMGLEIRMFRPMDTYRKSGTAATFTRSINYTLVEVPEGYSVEKVKKIAKKYMIDDYEEPEVKPNIISIVDETYADINVLGEVKTDKPVMPFFDSMKENTIRGWYYASVVGGQTANTEFEYLTGNTMSFLNPQAVAFQMYVNHPMESTVKYLKANGYQGLKAFHPNLASNYNRPRVYPNLGFSDFLSIADMGEKDVDYTTVRDYVSDKSSFDKVIEEYEAAKKESDAPFFMYNLTMQNHSPYNLDYDNLDLKIKVEGPAKKYRYVRRYLNLCNITDQAFKELTEYFEKKDDPTIIIFFGDHQPRVSDKFISLISNSDYASWSNEKLMNRYKVPYRIWANYDIEEEEFEDTSMNYMGANLFNYLGFKLTGWQRFLIEFEKKVPVITANGYYGDNGKFYVTKDKKSPYYKLLSEYKILQYNNVFDTDNTYHDFFELDYDGNTKPATGNEFNHKLNNPDDNASSEVSSEN
ncbi:MAG: sulfatase-like hydrolase/transferase [Lachnospiraceae bacterium]|nr:sulfatase-like hydrolase/transferase [Lachnospiraceae bacterium]